MKRILGVAIMLVAAIVFNNTIMDIETTNQIRQKFVIELLIEDSVPKRLVVTNDGFLEYYEQELRVEEDGSSVFVDQPPMKIQLPEEQVVDLAKHVHETNFFALNSRYEDESLEGSIPHIITVTINEQSRSVYCNSGRACPLQFTELQEKIINLWPDGITYIGFS